MTMAEMAAEITVEMTVEIMTEGWIRMTTAEGWIHTAVAWVRMTVAWIRTTMGVTATNRTANRSTKQSTMAGAMGLIISPRPTEWLPSTANQSNTWERTAKSTR